MQRRFLRSCLSLTAVSFCLAARSNGDQPSFQGLGFSDGGAYSAAYAVSNDGLAVAGVSGTGSLDVAFRWTAATGMVNLGLLSGSDQSGAFGLSADGGVVVGNSGDSASGMLEAFRWTEANGMVGLGDLPGGDFFSDAEAISADGTVIVGFSAAHDGPLAMEAYRWTQADDMTGLGLLPNGLASFGYAVSADGAVVAGTAVDENFVFQAFRWTQGDGMVALGLLPDGVESQGYGISADGSAVVGTSVTVNPDTFEILQEAIRWTQATGLVGLGFPPNSVGSQAFATSGDGAIVVGSATDEFGNPGAMLWTAADGMRYFQDILVNLGLGTELTGWTLIEIQTVSPDGTNFVGTGVDPDGYFQAWLAHVPRRVLGDLNCDGAVDFFDIDAFILALLDLKAYQNAYPGCDPFNGDVNNDGTLDFFDIDPFVACVLNSGC